MHLINRIPFDIYIYIYIYIYIPLVFALTQSLTDNVIDISTVHRFKVVNSVHSIISKKGKQNMKIFKKKKKV